MLSRIYLLTKSFCNFTPVGYVGLCIWAVRFSEYFLSFWNLPREVTSTKTRLLKMYVCTVCNENVSEDCGMIWKVDTVRYKVDTVLWTHFTWLCFYLNILAIFAVEQSNQNWFIVTYFVTLPLFTSMFTFWRAILAVTLYSGHALWNIFISICYIEKYLYNITNINEQKFVNVWPEDGTTFEITLKNKKKKKRK